MKKISNNLRGPYSTFQDFILCLEKTQCVNVWKGFF
jgi:hypothetical protein